MVVQAGQRTDSPFAVFVMGPTATGKTDLAIAIHEAFEAEIISVDSAMVYRQMAIGSARPDPETLRRAPHHLIDFIDPADHYSAGEFRDDALRLMERFTRAARVPVLAGGTMLYFKALQEGIAALPKVAVQIRHKIEQEYREGGLAGLYARLQRVDPESASRLHPNDTQRIKRALEIFDYSGKTQGDFWREQTLERLDYRCLKIALVPQDRAALRKRIARRFDSMLQQGLIDEVATLRRRGDLHPGLPAIRSVGYRQVWAYLEGEDDYDTMREKAVNATAQLARRQMTWLRKERDCNFFDPAELNTGNLLKKLRSRLL